MKRSPLKRKTPLRKQSKRRSKDYDEYMRKRDAFLIKNPICQLWLTENEWESSGNGIYFHEKWGHLTYSDVQVVFGAPRSTEIHHKCCGKNRKATYLREDTWMAVSAWGHDFIHKNPKLAYERGWLLKTIPEEPKCED